jgi:hypothetical protein
MQWISRIRFINKDADDNAAAQTAFYTTVTANYNADYSQFEDLTGSLEKQLQPIIAAGAEQYGFSATQDAAIRTQATETDAAAARNSEQATNQQITASEGGADLLPTGAQEQLRQQGNVAAAQKNASDQNAVTQEGYAQGALNYNNAVADQTKVLGMIDPNSDANSVSTAGNAANGAISAETAADSGWMSMVGGALGGVTGALTTKALK